MMEIYYTNLGASGSDYKGFEFIPVLAINWGQGKFSITTGWLNFLVEFRFLNRPSAK